MPSGSESWFVEGSRERSTNLPLPRWTASREDTEAIRTETKRDVGRRGGEGVGWSFHELRGVSWHDVSVLDYCVILNSS